MITVVSITLENEMDLVLAHKRTMKVAEKLGLTMSTQTTFATAVSEIARVVIDYSDSGVLTIGLEQQKTRYSLVACVNFDPDIQFTNSDAGFYYAQKLVPEFTFTKGTEQSEITMKIGIPRSLKLDKLKITLLQRYFEDLEPLNAYDEIKQRNISLHKITDQQEEELRRSKIIDEQKTEFISIASHEIKTPMTVLKAYTQVAKSTSEPISDKLRDLLGKIDLQSTKLMTLVLQLMDISKIEHGSLEYDRKRTSLNDFLTAQVQVMQSILPHNELSTNLCADVDVMIDELRMEQVCSNLIGNAAKYSGKNTNIRIFTAVLDHAYMTVGITDQGMGISEDNLNAIFNKFYRTEDVLKTHSGLGMGLYVTSKIIKDHGGRIWAESSVGEGSTFFFTLPRV
ncbi:ATP-binding protein [Pedobacter duraquae]|uniref:histidine kinase n=1 Tax=Pedobacter duraquae TaxID=425511 RepID=A0A4R6IET1_9SPHI|nr:sensor histidine kinase [Pedobacter duraquae]TDO20266.1 phospho-acceptor domain-containing protein [Pedobacter duraquae]